MEPLDDNLRSEGGLNFSPEFIKNLSAQAYWAKFLGMAGMIFIGFILVILLLMGGTVMSVLASSGTMGAAEGASGTFVLIFYVIFLGFGGYICFLLWDSGKKLQAGISMQDQYSIETGANRLATFFKINGILTIIGLGFYALMLVILLFLGGAAFLR